MTYTPKFNELKGRNDWGTRTKDEWKVQCDKIDKITKDSKESENKAIDQIFKDLGFNGESTIYKQGNLLDTPRHLYSHDAHPVGRKGEYLIFQWEWDKEKKQLTKLTLNFAFGTGVKYDHPMTTEDIKTKFAIITDYFNQNENKKLIEDAKKNGIELQENNGVSIIYSYEWKFDKEDKEKNANAAALNYMIQIYERWYIYASGNETDAKELLDSNYNLILHGAPGTGKTYMAENKLSEGCYIKEVQFHPSYDYTDFVEGLRPNTDKSFELIPGVFKKFCEEACEIETYFHTAKIKYFNTREENQEAIDAYYDAIEDFSTKTKISTFENNSTEINGEGKTGCEITSAKKDAETAIKNAESEMNKNKFVFIIDEINRGEISKIFGELFYSIDPGYRGEDGAIKTQYQNLNEKGVFKNGFYIPKNVFIVACMNEIDRSVEPMDFAMRRRFAWKNIKAADTQSDILNAIDISKPTIKKAIVKTATVKMNAVNAEIVKPEYGLGEEYQIGASYFKHIEDCKKTNNTDSVENYDWQQLLEYYLLPVINDYLNGRTEDIQKIIDAYNNAK